MDYTELKIYVPTKYTDEASNIAIMTVPYGIYIEDYSQLEKEAWEIAHIDLIDEDLLKKNREESVIHIYLPEGNNPAEAISFLSERFEAEAIPYKLEIVLLLGCKCLPDVIKLIRNGACFHKFKCFGKCRDLLSLKLLALENTCVI